MPTRATALFVALASALCFWLLYIFGLAGGPIYSIPRLLTDTFSTPNLLMFLLVAWAATFSCSFLLRNRFRRLALSLSIASPIFGLIATVNELLALHQGMLSLDIPYGEPIFVYMPRLAAASLMLAITLFGLSIQLLLDRPR